MHMSEHTLLQQLKSLGTDYLTREIQARGKASIFLGENEEKKKKKKPNPQQCQDLSYLKNYFPHTTRSRAQGKQSLGAPGRPSPQPLVISPAPGLGEGRGGGFVRVPRGTGGGNAAPCSRLHPGTAPGERGPPGRARSTPAVPSPGKLRPGRACGGEGNRAQSPEHGERGAQRCPLPNPEAPAPAPPQAPGPLAARWAASPSPPVPSRARLSPPVPSEFSLRLPEESWWEPTHPPMGPADPPLPFSAPLLLAPPTPLPLGAELRRRRPAGQARWLRSRPRAPQRRLRGAASLAPSRSASAAGPRPSPGPLCSGPDPARCRPRRSLRQGRARPRRPGRGGFGVGTRGRLLVCTSGSRPWGREGPALSLLCRLGVSFPSLYPYTLHGFT